MAALSIAAVSTIPVGDTGVGADTLPTPPTVSADALPTVQINGVVWSTVVVGGTVYAAGSFTKARPAGAAAGVSETTRNNLLAFDLATGKLITSFDHSLNGAGRAVTVSPDGRTVYVGGDFTTVDGQARGHVAAFDVASGALTAYNPTVSGSVAALTTTAGALYAGGTFTKAGGAVRTNVVAFDRSTGALLPWAPVADAVVTALTTSPDNSRVIVGGRFTLLNGELRRGLGAVDATTGASVSWNSPPFYDYGLNSGFTSLTHDDTNIYGTGYNYNSQGGSGNFEGRFAIKPDGTVVWIDDCHGDSYSIFVTGGVAYSAGHSHNCATQSAFPETNPRTWHRAIASTTTPTHAILRNTQSGYFNYAGRPAPTQLAWYPAMSTGTYTGAYQGPWAVGGDQNYVVMGGEFLKVNNKGQQGLVRYAVRSIAPNKIGPDPAPTALTPRATTPTSATVRLTWTSTSDIDDPALNYDVYRDDRTEPIGTVTAESRFWTLPGVSYVDTSAPTGRHTYRIAAVDSAGNSVTGGWSNAVDVSGGTPPSNAPPTARFTSSCTGSTCSFDASASTDSDGSVVGYRWDFGDGSSSTDVRVDHAYAAPGTYSVTLTVTDDDGATGDRTSSVVVAGQPPAGELARDTFARTVSGGFGTADTGGAWTSPNGGARLSVADGTGSVSFTSAGQSSSALLNAVSSDRTLVTTTVTMPTLVSGGGVYAYVTGRRVANGDQYRATVRVSGTGAVDGWISAVVGGTERVLARMPALTGFVYRAGQQLAVSFGVTGVNGTALSLSVSPVNTGTGPGQVSVNDATASLQAAGSIGLSAYASGSAGNLPASVGFSDLRATVP